MTHPREHSSLLAFLLHCFAFHSPKIYLYVPKKPHTTSVGMISVERGYSNLLGQPFSHLPTFSLAQPFLSPPTMVPAATSRLLCLKSDQEINALSKIPKLQEPRGPWRSSTSTAHPELSNTFSPAEGSERLERGTGRK